MVVAYDNLTASYRNLICQYDACNYKVIVVARYKIVAIFLVLVFVGLGTSAYAACPPIFSPPGHIIMPDDNAQVFLMYSEPERLEVLVIQPEFSGTATEFGMVMPIPSRPGISEAPEDMFELLLKYTTIRNPVYESITIQESLETEESVIVVERKDVGDFKTVVLTADSADALTEWLNNNDFEFKEEDRENFEYFVEKGGYYFVAMKVNMDEADLDDAGMINGKLRPIEFIFESEYPMLPLRIMAHDMDPMRFTLYTLGIFPYYIPGVDVLFMDVIDNPSAYGYEKQSTIYKNNDVIDNPSAHEAMLSSSGTTTVPHIITTPVAWGPILETQYLGNTPSPPKLDDERLGEEFWERYDPLNKWLVRMNVGFDPRGIEENLILERIGTVNGMIPDLSDPFQISDMFVDLKRPVIINEKLLPPGSGVFAERSSDWQDFQNVHEIISHRLQAEYGIPPQSIDCKSGMSLMILPGWSNTACMLESSVPALIERGWQESTFRAYELDRLR